MKPKVHRKGLLRLVELVGEKKYWLICSALLAIISTCAQFIPYITIFNIIRELGHNAASPADIDSEFIWHWCYIALISFVVYSLFLLLSLILSHIAAFNILYKLRMKLSNKLIRLPLGYFTTTTSGHIKKILAEDVDRLELFIAHHIPDIISAVLFPLFIMIYMFMIDWRLAIIIFVIFVAALITISYMNNERMKTVARQYVEILGKMNSSIVEFVRGIQVVKIFNRSTSAFERLNNNIDTFQKFSAQITRKWSRPYLSFNIILNATTLLIIPAAIYFLNNAKSYPEYLPTVLMFIILSGSIFFPMLKLLWIGGVISQVCIGVDVIDEVLLKEELPETSDNHSPLKPELEFTNVTFAYEKNPVIKNVSFKVPVGSLTALVGPSGAGKTTLALLAARFWDTSSGEIKIGGIPIKQLSYTELMNNISFVFQDNMLFFDTIEENIRMGNSEATKSQVIAAAKAAHCHDFITRLPSEYDTLVGEGGTYLSGGEQQRIALARAILKDAPIILLDEATAYADPENENKILKSFSKLIQDKTVMVIAHRLNTITNADNILYIAQQHIVESGTHEELLAQAGAYAKMWQSYTRAAEWVIGDKRRTNHGNV